jgi:hypothetical protein
MKVEKGKDLSIFHAKHVLYFLFVVEAVVSLPWKMLAEIIV